jgi:glycosyltransferase involved in cell wall biosynthesis
VNSVETSGVQPKLVSVIVPAYNAGMYLADALESVFAQDYRPLEVIVVDDGSTDDTRAVAMNYSQVRYLHQNNQGPPAARNTGLSNCKGDLIAFLDSDDLWVPGRLSMQAAYLEMHPLVGCVIGRMKNFLQEGTIRPSWVEESTLTGDLTAYALGALLTCRWVLEAVGGFNVSNNYTDDFDWLIRMKEANIPVEKVDEVLLFRRIHSGNLSHNQSGRDMKIHSRLRLLKEAIDRKRTTQLSRHLD